MNDKINTRFEFPNVLDLKEFSYKEVMRDCTDDEELRELKNIKDEDYLYKLVGVNVHVGTADHGHYYSIINTRRGSEENQNEDLWRKVENDPWKVFDDASIRHFNFSGDLVNEAFGGDRDSTKASSDAMSDKEWTTFLSSGNQSYGKSAYMLIYERKSKKNLVQIQLDSADD
jgi:ubiquitin carboxyl-terminal hydrolase 9/24